VQAWQAFAYKGDKLKYEEINLKMIIGFVSP
jgi:hypothetical protein